MSTAPVADPAEWIRPEHTAAYAVARSGPPSHKLGPYATGLSELARFRKRAQRLPVRSPSRTQLARYAEAMTEEPVWLTVGEAARRLGVTPQAVRARIKRGTLEGRPDNKGNLLVLVSESADNPPATREETLATLREQVARLEERRAADEETKAALRERIEELKGERDAERRRAEQAEIRHTELDAQLEAILRQLGELKERRLWPGLRVSWRRFWAGEG